MSKGDRDAGAALGLGVAFLVVFGLGWWAADYDSQKARDAYNAADQRADESDSERFRPCFALLPASPDRAFECIVDEARASREAQTAQYDLSAQQSMAGSTTRLIVVTIALSLIGFILTAVGIVYVWRTLKATRRSNRDQRRSSERQLRAYIVITGRAIRKLTPGSRPEVVVTFKNAGQTPAYGFEMVGGATRIDANADVPDPPEFGQSEFRHTRMLGPGVETLLTLTFKAAVTADDIAAIMNKQDMIFVAGRVRYVDAFEKDRWLNFNAFYGGRYGTNDRHAMFIGDEDAN